MPVCTWVCALSFGRCRMSQFFLLVYLDFFESLRPALARARRIDAVPLPTCTAQNPWRDGGPM